MTPSFPQRLLRTTGQLGLALLNATLILVIVALALLWRVSESVEGATTALATAASEQIARIAPVQDELRGLRADLGALREDLAALRVEASPGEAGPGEAALDAALERLDRTQARLSAAADGIVPALEAISADPGLVVDRAVASGVAEAGRWLAALRGCTPLQAS